MIKMKRAKKGLFILLAVSICLLFGCSKATETDISGQNDIAPKGESAEKTITLVVPKSPTSIPLYRMIETNALGENVKIDLQIYTDMEKMMAIATQNKYSFMAVPANAAVTLYNKGMDVKLLNIILWGGMYLSTTDTDCNSWEDLSGKKLFVPSKGSVTDIITQYFLSKHGLKIGEDLEVVYSNHVEIAQLIANGNAEYAIDVEPFVSFNKENIENYKVISNYAEEWASIEGDEYDMPCFGVLANSDFLKNNKEIVGIFNKELEEAIKWSLDNPAEAGLLAEQYNNSKPEMIEKSIINYRYIYKSADVARKDIEKYCNVILSGLKPECVGGKIPDENFYYQAK
jgi:NitT/TauT family transport system substrate-binding protein